MAWQLPEKLLEVRGWLRDARGWAGRRPVGEPCALHTIDRNSAPLRPGVALVLLFLAFRPECCFQECTTTWGGSSSDVESIKIIPPDVQVAPGERFELRAVVETTEGKFLPVELDLAIEWSGSDGFSPSTGNPTILTAPSEPGAVLQIQASLDDKSSAPAVVRVVDPDVVGTGALDQDAFHVWHGDGEAPSAVLVDATSEDGWKDDLLRVIASKGVADVNLLDGGNPETTIFSTDKALHLETPPTSEVWTSGADLLQRLNELQDPLEVEVKIWASVAGGGVISQIEREVELASRIFRANRVGFKLTSDVVYDDGVDTELPEPDLACAAVPGQFGIDLAKNDLNVLYVREMEVSPGKTCTTAGLPGALVIIAWTGHTTTTLAHELVHVMGLRDGHLPCSGHTGGMAHGYGGFETSNVMWTYLSPSDKSNRRHLSLGQVYRMSVDNASWLNGSVRDGATKDCQFDPDAAGPCPPVALDVSPPSSMTTYGLGYCGSASDDDGDG